MFAPLSGSRGFTNTPAFDGFIGNPRFSITGVNKMQYNKIATVKGLVAQRGGWTSIFANYAGLNQAMDRGFRQQPCPLSGEGKTKFRFFKDWQVTGGAYHNDMGAMPDGLEVITWYTGKSKAEVLDELVDICGGKSVLDAAKPVQVKPRVTEYCSKEEAEKRKQRIKKVWKESQPIVGSLAETYLRSRGISADLRYLGNNLRFHPAMPYKEDDDSKWVKFPCMLAVYRDKNGKALTLHRTFLKPDGSGKADVSRPKMIMAPPRDMRGGYIVLDKPQTANTGKYIGIAEGIENSLSAREAMGCAMFCGYSDRLMAMTNFPEEVSNIFVFADKEPSGAGIAAAEALKEANKDKDVLIMSPESEAEKIDWNDIYQTQGHNGFKFVLQEQWRVAGVDIPTGVLS
jgi:putative DNA primase/helicase